MVFLAIAAGILLLLLLIRYIRQKRKGAAILRAGKQGEKEATGIIRSVMRKGDILFTNIPVRYRKMRGEIDNVLINESGVFLIEVKNYSGKLYGSENAAEWEKVRITRGKRIYKKTVKNPISQVMREEALFSADFDCVRKGIPVYGYVYLLQSNSPVKSKRVLGNAREIDRAVHRGKKISAAEAKALAAEVRKRQR